VEGIMQKKPRGGRRPGAGRPSNLTETQWVLLGDAIEWRLVREAEAVHQKAVIAEVAALEPSLPDRWQKLWKKRELTDDVELNIFDNQEDMKMIVHELSVFNNKSTQMANSERPLGLYAFAPKKAPAGIIGPIIRSVAAELSSQWNVRISLRTAETCWAWHQKSMSHLRKGGKDDYIPKPDNEGESGDV
jgi:hypothetical protein